MAEPTSPVVIVAGLDGGVGGALAATLRARDYEVLGTVFDEDARVRVALASPGSAPEIADLADEEAVAGAMRLLVDRAGNRLAAVVVCAGISPPGPLEVVPIETVRHALQVNVLSNLAIYQACMPGLRSTGGRFLMISSNAGKVAFPYLGPYVASKHALEGMADVMRQEAALSGVAVVLIEPGGIRTGMIADTVKAIESLLAAFDPLELDIYGPPFERLLSIARAGARDGLAPEKVAETIVKAIETKRPRTRYVLGGDALATISLRRNSSDRRMDAMFAQAYSSETGALDTAGVKAAEIFN